MELLLEQGRIQGNIFAEGGQQKNFPKQRSQFILGRIVKNWGHRKSGNPIFNRLGQPAAKTRGERVEI